MVLNKRTITKILFAVMGIIGASLLVPLVVSLVYGEIHEAKCFAVCAFPMLGLSVLAVRLLPKQDNSELRMRDGFFIVACTWLLMSLAGCLPFVISGTIPDVATAFFETASGFTTTGASALTELESLPRGMIFWRSFTHWLGGMGVLVLTIALLPMLGIGGQKIMRAETTGPTMDKISFTINEGARMLYKIYAGLTLLLAVLLLFCGMDLYNAVIHAFGTLGTGGFSSWNNSIGHYDSLAIHLVLSMFMLAAGINFNLYAEFMRTGKPKVFNDPELKTYLFIVVCSVGFLSFMLARTGTYQGFGESLHQAVFQVASTVSSTGFAITDYEPWPSSCKFVIIFLMFVGACAGSTAGGLKVIRLLLYAKLVRRSIRRRLSPRSFAGVKLAGKDVSDDTLNGVAALFGLYMAILLVGTFIITLNGTDLMTAFSSILTCLSNIGPGFNLVGPTCNFAFYPAWIKILLSVIMIGGRLELFTIAVLFSRDFWK